MVIIKLEVKFLTRSSKAFRALLPHQVFENTYFWKSESLCKKALAPYAEIKNTDMSSLSENSVILQSDHPQQVPFKTVLPSKLSIILTHFLKGLFNPEA